jgi:hypothetical protein
MPVLETAEDVRGAFDLPQPQGAPEPQQAPQPEKRQPDAGEFRFLRDRPTRTVELEFPFEYRGVAYRSYTLRRLDSGEASEVGDELRRTGELASLYAAVSGLPFQAVKRMDADDAARLAREALPFMPAALRLVLGLSGTEDGSSS